MANGSEHMSPDPPGYTKPEHKERIQTIVYYPSPFANLQECTRCELILTGRAERCPVCGGVKDPTGEGVRG